MGYLAAAPGLEYILLFLLTPRITVSEESVYFTMDSYITTIPSDYPAHQAVVQVYTRVTPPNASASYALEVIQSFRSDGRASHGRDGGKETANPFAIEKQTGRIFLQESVDARDILPDWNFTLQISAWTQRENPGLFDVDAGPPAALALVTVRISPSPPPCACFGDAGYAFRLRPYADGGAFGALWSDPQCLTANGASLKYSFLPDPNPEGVYIDNQTSELVLIRRSAAATPLQSRNLTVKCTAVDYAGGGNQTRTETRAIAILVVPAPDYVISVRQDRSKGDHIVWIQTNDQRVQSWQTIDVSLAGKHQDAYDFIQSTSASPTSTLEQPSDKIIGALTLNHTFPWCYAARHSLTVYLRDNVSQSAANQRVAVNVQINIRALRNELNLTLHRNASLYTRVAALEFPPCEPMSTLLWKPPASLVQDGGLLRLESSSLPLLVYVGDTSALSNRSLTRYAAAVRRHVGWRDGSLTVELVLWIQIIGEREATETYATCSQHKTKEECINDCGIGAPDGRCKWRQQLNDSNVSTNFSTCSPDFGTCPNASCDGLERRYPRLCPQDCIEHTDGFEFAMKLNDNGVGIMRAIGPCSCDFTGLECMCMSTNPRGNLPRLNTMLQQQRVDPTTVDPVPYSLLTTVSPRRPAGPASSAGSASGADDCTFCDTLFSVVAAVLALCVVAFLLYRRVSRGSPLRRLFTSKGRDYKPPAVIGGSDSRLNSVLSECSDDGLHLSKGSLTRLKTEFDPKWEFSRRNLVLDKVLGEGEFGCVVRAQALSLRGHTGYTTVAVKMLKGSYSTDDLRDLITEMNLLKDLNHPNVVKLLGASTQKGPLYVIVEYCRHGCLRDFLRRNRSTAVDLDDNCSLQGYDKIHEEGGRAQIVYNNRDLLSFAWQICKGMQYLAMLKLVHRDLAARNILVSDGMVIKVSDFGLTRDLYESGTYVKTSKSRIPMKWMAPESLFDNIYTTKTDIWSFGVLFWEILTMGAMPYPGMMSHKLCQLIRQGYRLERPDGCAEEIYNIMQQCWLSNPKDRPDFEVVGAMLERIMEKDADYLDLSCLPYGDCSDQEGNSSSEAEDTTLVSNAVPLLLIPTSDSTEIMPLSVSLKKDHQLTDDLYLKETIAEEETNVDSGPLYGDMDPCRLYSNINNNFITDHICKTTSEPNLTSTIERVPGVTVFEL